VIYLFDTNALSDYVRETPGMASRLATLASFDRVLTCAVVLGEVLHGIERLPASRRRDQLEQKTAQALRICRCKPVPVSAAGHYARIKSQLQRAGLPLDENDLWIAATALAFGATVISRDDHFQRIPGLAVEDWTR
jgi:tRNA(fMet)-specific endonuclease VapC